jgi:GDP-4-dehydro-6-deoxy-D-mannose reductase
MKTLVTGARGFAGPYLVDHLRACGDEVITIDRTGAEPVDITDRAAVFDALAHHRPEVVYHLAAFTHVGESFERPDRVLRVNVEGTANVLDAAREAGARRVVVAGSAEEYGAVAECRPITESDPLRPVSPYAVSKVAASYLAAQAWLARGLATIRVRAFNHTGPHQMPKFLVPALAHRIVTAERGGDARIAIGNTDPVRDLSDVRDVVRAYRLLAEHGVPGEVYNVASGREVTVADIADALIAQARVPVELVTDPALVRPVDIPYLVGDASKLRAATGWEPAFTLEQTLADVVDSARAGEPA